MKELLLIPKSIADRSWQPIGDDMGKKIILDKKTKRIKGFLNLEEDRVEKGTEKLAVQKYSPKSDELVITENGLDFKVDGAEVGDKVDGRKLVQDELKRYWLYHLGKTYQIGGRSLIREKETLRFDNKLSPQEEEELGRITGKEILKKEDNSGVIEKIRTTPGLRAGDELMSDEKKKFIGEIQKKEKR